MDIVGISEIAALAGVTGARGPAIFRFPWRILRPGRSSAETKFRSG